MGADLCGVQQSRPRSLRASAGKIWAPASEVRGYCFLLLQLFSCFVHIFIGSSRIPHVGKLRETGSFNRLTCGPNPSRNASKRTRENGLRDLRNAGKSPWLASLGGSFVEFVRTRRTLVN